MFNTIYSNIYRPFGLLLLLVLLTPIHLLHAQNIDMAHGQQNNKNSSEEASTRLISAGAGITELVLALGGEKNLIGTDSSSQIPAQLAQVTQVGYHRMLSAEGLLSLHPDVLLGSDVMGPEKTLALLRSANVHVVSLPSATNQAGLFNNIDIISQLLGSQQQAEKLKSNITKQLTHIKSNHIKLEQSKQPIKVLFMLLQAGRPAKVGGKGTAADTIIQLAGGENSAPFSGYKILSQEGILSLQPDVILLSSRQDLENTDKTLFPLLANMPLIASTKAYQQQSIFTIPAHALIGGLGLSAINEAETLSQQLISVSTHQ
ncbi:heme/hemin ABC transporter substrate-binding protein [Shewanella surugensis]|uniref:ABC transporter substrate-binding protein n=1 Tax=Shewanella surugensis TaxID=212020 RepID=A0ABT0L9Y6_9GAMM|nr:ABC transporter substrate-binding protein [Shewanella surugensis]MCL1124531.1 ABC transporter substrate-binding protein [Shewanella surugensis]